MREEGAFMALNIVDVTWKSTSSSGWEYFKLCERTWVWVLCMPFMCVVLLLTFNNMYERGSGNVTLYW